MKKINVTENMSINIVLIRSSYVTSGMDKLAVQNRRNNYVKNKELGD